MYDQEKNLETIWNALAGYRENLIPEHDSFYDDEWSSICEAMAEIRDGLGLLDEVEHEASKPFSLGSISHGTLKLEDLARAFIDHFHMESENAEIGSGGLLVTLKAVEDDPEGEHVDEMFQEACDLLESHDRFPPYCYLGMHEGDGSDFGIWISWESVEEACYDGEILKVSDLSEVDETHGEGTYSGEVLHVNDHGNASLYLLRAGVIIATMWEAV